MSNKFELTKIEFSNLKHIIKRYCNFYKALYHFNPTSADEFSKKQEFYFKQRKLPSNHKEIHPNCENVFKMERKFYIPKEKLNNIEKNLFEIYESFFFPSNLNDFLIYFSQKFDKISKSGISQGLTLDKESEKELMHRLLLEGVPFYINRLLINKIKKYEESISEQPMLLANPSMIKEKRMVNFIPSKNIEEIIKNDLTIIDKNIYEEDLNCYEIYNQIKYLYMEGIFEDNSAKEGTHRTDFLLNFNINYFEKSKHKIITTLTHSIYALPFELNMKYPNFQLQTNDYIQLVYFRENFSFIGKSFDCSLKFDTGKKLIYFVVLFPDEVELSKRVFNIKIYSQKNDELISDVKLTKPLSGIIVKARKVKYEIPKHNFPFAVMMYFIHGPIDRENNF